MATGFSLTNRLKIPVIEEGNTNWLSYLTHWAELMDVMFTVLSNKDYVISGLEMSSDPTSLDFSYSSGSASINGSVVNIGSGSGSTLPDTFNWVYVQDGQIKVSTSAPTGIDYVPVACLQTDSIGVIGPAELRPSPPSVNGVSIRPEQVNPTGHINMAAGTRILHVDSNVGMQTIMFNNSEVQTLVNWGNQASAQGWTDVSVAPFVPDRAKFVVLNCYMATYRALANDWAVLEVKTGTSHDDNVHNFVDYGHPDAISLNTSQKGHVNQIILPIESKKFRARTLIDDFTGSAVYYASIKLMGYIL